VIAGVLLAAGGSSRLGRPKQLLPLAGRPLIAHALGSALASGLDQVVVVLGHEAAAIQASIEESLGRTRARIVVNLRYAEGQATSVVAGLTALGTDTEAALFLLGDQPGVGAAMIDTLLATFLATPAPIVAPTYAGTIGNPVLFSRDLFPELLRLTGDEGARGVVRRHLGETQLAEMGMAEPPQDIDTEADYQAFRTAWDAAGHPSGIKG
jgi:molybdenum cofactor cytidylyltransferase